MKQFFFCLFSVFFIADGISCAYAQDIQAEEVVVTDESVVEAQQIDDIDTRKRKDKEKVAALVEHFKTLDPDAPAQESPIKVRIPHSERTKENFADSFLDFTLTKLFKQFDGMIISYDFFSFAEMGDLAFKNFTIELKKPSTTGTIKFASFQVSLKELLGFLRTKKAVVGRVVFEKAELDLKLIDEKDGKKVEKLVKASVKSAELKQIRVFELIRKERPAVGNQEFTAEQIIAKDASLSFPGTKERYKGKEFDIKNIEVRIVAPHTITFDSAVIDGTTYNNSDAVKKALRQK